MKGKVMILVTVLSLVLLLGCASIENSYSEGNYNNPKPDREAREKYISAHPELSPMIHGLIKNGLVDDGMSKEEVKASWGEPDSINSTSKFGADEMWYYWDNPKFHRYVYFRQGIVISVE